MGGGITGLEIGENTAVNGVQNSQKAPLADSVSDFDNSQKVPPSRLFYGAGLKGAAG